MLKQGGGLSVLLSAALRHWSGVPETCNSLGFTLLVVVTATALQQQQQQQAQQQRQPLCCLGCLSWAAAACGWLSS
jgi:hypothetical protein